VGHAQGERREGVVVVGAVCVGESVSTGRCDVCASVTVEGSGEAICWSLTTSVVVLESEFNWIQLYRLVWNTRIDMLIAIGKKKWRSGDPIWRCDRRALRVVPFLK